MLTANGKSLEAHRKSLATVQAPFDTSVVAKFVRPIINYFEEHNKERLSMFPLMKKLTFSIFSFVSYGEEYDMFHIPQIFDLLTKLLKYAVFEPFIMFPFLQILFPFSLFAFRHDLNVAHGFARDLLEKNSVSGTNTIASLKKSATEGLLSEEEVVNTITAGFIGGHDTTDSTVTSTLYCLARFPELQEKVYREISAVVEGVDVFEEGISSALLEKMPYLLCFLKEAMRMYPAAPFVPLKYTSKDTVLAGYKIKKDTVVMVDVFATHHANKYWPDPFKFDPNRFLDESKIVPFSYIPFGAGARACFGKQFALMEVRNIVALLLLKFKISLPPDSPHKDEPVLSGAGILAFKDLKMVFSLR